MDGVLTNNQNVLVGKIHTNKNVLRPSVNRNSKNLRAFPYNSTPLNYENLYNKPQIESVELIGNRELEEIGVNHLSVEDLIHILD